MDRGHSLPHKPHPIRWPWYGTCLCVCIDVLLLVYMCVCMCLWVCACTYPHGYMCVGVFVHMCVHVCTHACVYIRGTGFCVSMWRCVYMHVCQCKRVCMSVFVHVCTHVHLCYVYRYMHVHGYLCVHKRVYGCVCVCVLVYMCPAGDDGEPAHFGSLLRCGWEGAPRSSHTSARSSLGTGSNLNPGRRAAEAGMGTEGHECRCFYQKDAPGSGAE